MSFRDLHHTEAPLLLPNAWDVGSAIAFADAGFPAVGTTSFGIGAAAGRPDGIRASKKGTADLVQCLSELQIYVSADIEDGYSDDPREVADLVAELGADGINIEDSTGGALVDPIRHAEKITQIKLRSPETFVNARVDNYWVGQDTTVLAVLERAHVYAEAGADGIFVPGVTAQADLSRVATEIPLPVNSLVVPGLTLEDLARLGIRRVSTGSLAYRAAIDAAVDVPIQVRDGATPPTAISYSQAQARLAKYAGMIAAYNPDAETARGTFQCQHED